MASAGEATFVVEVVAETFRSGGADTETAGGTGAFKSLVEAGVATASGGGAADVVPEPAETVSSATGWGKAGSLTDSESCIWGCGDCVTGGEDPAATASFSDGFSDTDGNLASPATLLEVAAGTAVCDELKKLPNERDVEAEGVEVDVLILFAC